MLVTTEAGRGSAGKHGESTRNAAGHATDTGPLGSREDGHARPGATPGTAAATRAEARRSTRAGYPVEPPAAPHKPAPPLPRETLAIPVISMEMGKPVAMNGAGRSARSASSSPSGAIELRGLPELPGAEVPGAELPGAGLPGAELPGAGAGIEPSRLRDGRPPDDLLQQTPSASARRPASARPRRDSKPRPFTPTRLGWGVPTRHAPGQRVLRGLRGNAEEIVARAQRLPAEERRFVEQVFARGLNVAEVSRLAGRDPRADQKRLRSILKLMNNPLFTFLLYRGDLVPRRLRVTAEAIVFRRLSLRQTARLTRRSLHCVRERFRSFRAIACVHSAGKRLDTMDAAQSSPQPSRATSP